MINKHFQKSHPHTAFGLDPVYGPYIGLIDPTDLISPSHSISYANTGSPKRNTAV